MADIFLSDFVDAEIEEIYEYIAADNFDAAVRFLDATNDTFQRLVQSPTMGPLRNLGERRFGGIRSMRVKGFENYLVFYRPVDGGIEVIHILHGARDIQQFWNEH